MLLKERTVENFMQTLAGDDGNAPGGGALSAMAGALGTGCLVMVAKLTAGLKRFADEAPYCLEIAAQAQPYVQEFTDGIDYDIECYYGIVNAFRLPKSTDEEKAARRAAIDQATLVAAEAPFAVLRKAAEVLMLCEKLEGHYNPMAVSDFAAAVIQLRSSATSAWHNVLVNAKGIEHMPRAKELLTEGEALYAQAKALADRLVQNAEGQM